MGENFDRALRLLELAAESDGMGGERKLVSNSETPRPTIKATVEAAEVPVAVRATVKKTEDDLQIVWGEVYVPEIPDAHGHFMSTEEVRKMAWRTLASGLMSDGEFIGSDVQHDNVVRDCVMVESFVARKGDPTFLEGSWVVALHIKEPEIWALVKKGTLNGFSMQASVFMQKREVEVELPEQVAGSTGTASSGDLHGHGYTVRFSAEGKFLGGSAKSEALDDGSGRHEHAIVLSSVTEPGGDDSHTHRFALLDSIFGRPVEDGDLLVR